MNPVFEAKLNEYILSPQRVQGEPLPADYVYDEDFFNLLHLVREPTR